ncbi:MAG: hypothetical protein JST61_06490 [Acidobacteria bacterium]|nr:hypothetical protein [Acidobacteriota bacterium]
MKLKEIGWEEIWGALRRKSPAVIAAVCTAEADGTDPKYAAGQRRELLVMLRATAQEPEAAIQSWLRANGWTNATVLEHRLLEETFDSGDNEVRACYVNAMASDGACLVYGETAET